MLLTNKCDLSSADIAWQGYERAKGGTCIAVAGGAGHLPAAISPPTRQRAEVVTKTDSAQFLAPRDVQEATITNSYAGFVSRFSGKPWIPGCPKPVGSCCVEAERTDLIHKAACKPPYRVLQLGSRWTALCKRPPVNADCGLLVGTRASL